MRMSVAMWMLIGGVAVDVIDALTNTGGLAPAGKIYGPGGPLNFLYEKTPAGLTPGLAVAGIGAVMVVAKK